MATAANTKMSFQLSEKTAKKLKLLATGVGKSPSALVRETIVALTEGRIKLPALSALDDVYK